MKLDLNFGLGKRQKIIFTSGVLCLGLLSTQLVPFYLTYRFLAGLTVLTYVLSLWALWEGISGLKAVILMILPTLFTLAIASYYFLLPVRWLTRLPVALVFALTFYTLLLSQNVFNVASIRTIPLYRAASTTVFILTLITSYLMFSVLFSFNMLFIWNGIWTFLLSFLLILQVIWSIDMESLSGLNLAYSAILSLVIAEVGLTLSFWPISHTMASLVLSTLLFVVLGTSTHALRDRLGKEVTWEYIGWGVVVFIVAFFTTSWVG